MDNSDNLKKSIQYVKSIGPKRAESFTKIGISCINDLLFYFPSRYLDRSNLLNSVKIVQHLINGYEGEVTVVAEVLETESIRYGKKQIFKAKMKDAAGYFECVWFQGIKYITNVFTKGETFAISGKPVITKYGNLQFAHPDFDKFGQTESTEFLNTGKIIPFYRVPKELRSTNIGDLSIRRIINNVVKSYAKELLETLPAGIINENKLLDIVSAVTNIHFPGTKELLSAAQKRFKYEELFYIESLVALRKYHIKIDLKGYNFHFDPKPIKKFLKSLPFELTKAQLKVLSDIRSDMENTKPMNRLLQGDVGSGKTIVAVIAMLVAVDNGYQASLVAPTEILAAQHYENIKKLLEDFDIKINLLIGGQRKAERQKVLKSLNDEESNIVIGTHALMEETVSFNKLGIVIIDEQHRFGVIQRSKLIYKGYSPDVLVMTATPIPRTLSMTVYGDLDLSIIDEMPEGRKKIKTILRGENKLPDIYKFILQKIKEGYQAYIVFPLVEESDKINLKAAESYYEKLKTTFFKDVNVGLIHGRMNWKDKEDLMKNFAEKKYDVLISTTVIEVGIDVASANIIVINDAFRFGLSQLHQLRGRVGRSEKQAYCILVTKPELAVKANQLYFNFDYLSAAAKEKNKSIIRLNSMVKYSSGFDLSEVDFKLRGPGDIFGTDQSGFPELKYADLISDTEILIKAKQDAFNIISVDPKLLTDENQLIKKILSENYQDKLKLSRIA